MIAQSTSSKGDVSALDRIHSKVKSIESNLKTFKLKSRTAYDDLVDQEMLLQNELDAWNDKFDAYSQEPSAVVDLVTLKKSSN